MEWKKPDALVGIDWGRDSYIDPGKYIDRRRERDIDRCREIEI